MFSHYTLKMKGNLTISNLLIWLLMHEIHMITPYNAKLIISNLFLGPPPSRKILRHWQSAPEKGFKSNSLWRRGEAKLTPNRWNVQMHNNTLPQGPPGIYRQFRILKTLPQIPSQLENMDWHSFANLRPFNQCQFTSNSVSHDHYEVYLECRPWDRLHAMLTN